MSPVSEYPVCGFQGVLLSRSVLEARPQQGLAQALPLKERVLGLQGSWLPPTT